MNNFNLLYKQSDKTPRVLHGSTTSTFSFCSQTKRIDLFNFTVFSSSAKEFCKVTFAFEATNEDELSLREGEIVHVLSKVRSR